MKKWIVLCMLMLLLTGCRQKEVFETVTDVYAPVAETPQKISLKLPSDAAVTTLSGSEGTLYLCDSYTVWTQILAGGDLARTLKSVTGFSPERLTLMTREKDGFTTYRCAWTAAGEGGDQVARTYLIDDGTFHYAITVMASENAGSLLEETWQEIFDSVSLYTG